MRYEAPPRILAIQLIRLRVEGTNMVKAAKESPNINDNLVCICHILSNVLKDSFEIPALKDAIDMLRELASCTHKSLQRTLAIKKECVELGSELFLIIIN